MNCSVFPNSCAAVLALALAGCGQVVVSTPPPDCASFIPPAWEKPVPGAPLPAITAPDPLRSWMQFGVEMGAQLEKANGRQADTLHIVRECERRAREARPRRKVLGLF